MPTSSIAATETTRTSSSTNAASLVVTTTTAMPTSSLASTLSPILEATEPQTPVSVTSTPDMVLASAPIPAVTVSTTSSSAGADPSVSSAPASETPRRKRLRPSELNNLDLYRTIPNESSPNEPFPNDPIPCVSSVRRNSSVSQHPPLSRRWSSTKNVRNVTTGSLALGLLPISVSPEIVERFMEISSENSKNKIETGALLAGSMVNSSHFEITNLVIPKQIGRSDYWEAVDEAEIQEYFSSNQLLLLGCIHTHPPPWTSFLSSVDLHQLFDFQKDNPSSVSIVSGL